MSLISKPQGYDEAQAYTGDFEKLPPGGYVCKILRAEEEYTAKTNKRMLVIHFDIAEGDFKGFYKRKYGADAARHANAKWQGVYKQLMEGNSLPYFSGLIKNIEESNGFAWNWETETLKGKLFGGVFGREEFLSRDGTKRLSTKIMSARSVKAVRDGIEPPPDKLLNDGYGGESSRFAPGNDEDDYPF